MAAMDSGALYMNMLKEHADNGLEILADVAQHPAFRTEDIERDRKQRLVRIAQEGDNVSNMAMRAGPKLVFGEQPYRLSSAGTTESISSITSDDIGGFYRNHYGPQD